MNDSKLRKQIETITHEPITGYVSHPDNNNRSIRQDYTPKTDALMELFNQALTARLDAVAGALPEKKQHQDWCDLLSIAAYANPEDVACSCDTPAFNEALAACHAAIDTVREGL